MGKKGGDLCGNFLGLNWGLHGSGTSVAPHKNPLRASCRRAIFQTRNDFWGDHIAGNPRYKDMTNSLIEYHFDGDTGIGARQQGREWLLLVYCILFEDR